MRLFIDLFTESMPQVFVPKFTGSSYMEIPLLDKVEDSLSIEIWFRPLQPNGLSTVPPLCVICKIQAGRLIRAVPVTDCKIQAGWHMIRTTSGAFFML